MSATFETEMGNVSVGPHQRCIEMAKIEAVIFPCSSTYASIKGKGVDAA